MVTNSFFVPLNKSLVTSESNSTTRSGSPKKQLANSLSVPNSARQVLPVLVDELKVRLRHLPYGLVVALRGFVLEGFQTPMHDRVLLSQKSVDLLVGLANPGLEVDGCHCCSPGSAEPSRESGKEHPDS